DNVLIATDVTTVQIPVGGQISMTKEIEITDNIADVFELTLVIDDVGDGTGVVEELDETNNVYITTVTIFSIPEIGNLDDLEVCNEGFGYAIFDLTEQNENISTTPEDEISYYISYDDALNKYSPISSPNAYESIANPQIVYVRLENETCFRIASFYISTKDCPPTIPEGFSPNNDNKNDYFEIIGLLDIFPDHEILIYSRYGNLIFRGNNETGFWDGNANEGLLYEGPVPVGVYYYVLNLNHPDYELFIGWVYLNK
ncbi:MAG: gliding motility-associated C-terminal domain-containing protein, partial [Flavobacteriaceae bacterium]